MFLLEIDEPTMLARIDARQDNDWGRIGDTREYLRRKLPELQDRLRALGAIPIDARQPLDQVVDAILSCTLAGPPADVSHFGVGPARPYRATRLRGLCAWPRHRAHRDIGDRNAGTGVCRPGLVVSTTGLA